MCRCNSHQSASRLGSCASPPCSYRAVFTIADWCGRPSPAGRSSGDARSSSSRESASHPCEKLARAVVAVLLAAPAEAGAIHLQNVVRFSVQRARRANRAGVQRWRFPWPQTWRTISIRGGTVRRRAGGSASLPVCTVPNEASDMHWFASHTSETPWSQLSIRFAADFPKFGRVFRRRIPWKVRDHRRLGETTRSRRSRDAMSRLNMIPELLLATKALF